MHTNTYIWSSSRIMATRSTGARQRHTNVRTRPCCVAAIPTRFMPDSSVQTLAASNSISRHVVLKGYGQQATYVPRRNVQNLRTSMITLESSCPDGPIQNMNMKTYQRQSHPVGCEQHQKRPIEGGFLPSPTPFSLLQAFNASLRSAKVDARHSVPQSRGTF